MRKSIITDWTTLFNLLFRFQGIFWLFGSHESAILIQAWATATWGEFLFWFPIIANVLKITFNKPLKQHNISTHAYYYHFKHLIQYKLMQVKHDLYKVFVLFWLAGSVLIRSLLNETAADICKPFQIGK